MVNAKISGGFKERPPTALTFKGKLIAFNTLTFDVTVHDGQLPIVEWVSTVLQYEGTSDTGADDVHLVYVEGEENQKKVLEGIVLLLDKWQRIGETDEDLSIEDEDEEFYKYTAVAGHGFSEREPGGLIDFLSRLLDYLRR